MTSRLDRLVLLLDTGSTTHIRNTAASQLGDIARQKPEETYHLLARVVGHLRSKSWETRTAAGLAIEHILQGAYDTDPWDPDLIKIEDGSSISLPSDIESLYTLQDFSLLQILQRGRKLLGSAGNEYDAPDLSDLDANQRLAIQKKNLTMRLGMGSQFMDMDNLMQDTDVTSTSVVTKQESITSAPPSPTSPDTPGYNMENLSARERNLLKRKQKVKQKTDISKVRVVDIGRRMSSVSGGTPTAMKIFNGKDSDNDKDAYSITEQPQQENKIVLESKVGKRTRGSPETTEGGENLLEDTITNNHVYDASTLMEWPFANLAEVLLTDLFDPKWECRHGAGIGLRSLLKVAGKHAGKLRASHPSKSNQQLHTEWLEDIIIRVLCVFALDRFGDFVSDTVVAPVRETVAQVLGVISILMDPDLFVKTINQLETMVDQRNTILKDLDVIQQNQLTNGRSIIWEVRHAGLLGLKYVVAARRDLVAVKTDQGRCLLSTIVDTVVTGLRDKDDDVRAAAASTLIPVVNELVNNSFAVGSSNDDVLRVLAALWAGLKDLNDDLTASTASVMDLLRELVSNGTIVELLTSKNDPPTIKLAELIRHEENQAELDDDLDDIILSDNENDLPKVSDGVIDLMSHLIPRLYPFFRHTISSVRTSVVNALLVFLSRDDSEKYHTWIRDIRLFQLVFQNLIVEQNLTIRHLSSQLWKALVKTSGINVISDQMLSSWLTLTMTPWNNRLDTSLFFIPKGSATASLEIAAKKPKRKSKSKMDGKVEQSDIPTTSSVQGYNVDAGAIDQDASLVGQEVLLQCKVAAASALGQLISLYSSNVLWWSLLSPYVNSIWGLQKQVAAIIIEESALSNDKLTSELSTKLSDMLIESLNSSTLWTYSEMSPILQRLKVECQTLLNAFTSEGRIDKSHIPAIPLVLPSDSATSPSPAGSAVFSLEVATYVAQTLFDSLIGSVQQRRVGAPTKGSRGRKRGGSSVSSSPANLSHMGDPVSSLKEKQRHLIGLIGYFASIKEQIDLQAQAAFASAIIALEKLPPKLNPVIRSIMNAIKGENNTDMQQRAAKALARLIRSLSEQAQTTGKPSPSDKIIKNLCTFLCQDTSSTPIFAEHKDIHDTILSLQRDLAPKLSSKSTKNRKGAALTAVVTRDVMMDSNKDAMDLDNSKIIRRGAEMAFAEIAKVFREQVFTREPQLWQSMTAGLSVFSLEDNIAQADQAIAAGSGQTVIDALSVISVVVPHLHPKLHYQIIEILPMIIRATRSMFPVVRYSAAQTIAIVCDVITSDAIQIIIRHVIPLLGDVKVPVHRQGSAEVIYRIVQRLDFNILPYVIFLIVPILGRMSDTNEPVRLIATNTFATLIKLVPLESGVPDPPGMSAEMLEKRDTERRFLRQLLDSSKLEPFTIPIKVNAELRKYQQDGVNWLAFLNKYHLHGILCDDMGLGKTLQSICILASDHYLRREKFEKTKSPESAHIPSLVVCPPTLTGHWYHEILQYVSVVKPLVYTGHPTERKRLLGLIPKHDVVVTSYDIVRNDVNELSTFDWNYCILDEGHVIKNAKTKLTQAVKMMKANHRLILSGTPIQNNVLELWSLFDFLMPGFLGTEKMFNERFGKPILASREAKSSSKEQEAGVLALEALHKQVLPFLLRRLKEDVLGDLPPKIIQDYYCDLSDLQKSLYEDFSKTQARTGVKEELDGGDDDARKKPTHVFQALQYLRKLVNHPLLVVKPDHPEYAIVQSKLRENNTTLHDLVHAPKLQALRQLLLDCGIGTQVQTMNGSQAADEAVDVLSQHRVLIFCQMKQMLDIIECDLFKNLMPSVTYMRLDGSTDATKRHGIVQKFNKDPSIDVLLLTTHVGGLGLNLTGADTVIFVEHDWNPSKDLQAMDRAHRIGQKKVVNVYRLITRGTLEEKIMGLQKFKINIANSIVNQQNSGLSSMDTDQIIDLFSIGDEKPKKKDDKKTSTKNVLEGIGELWDSNQYEEEYNLENFMETLKK